MLRQSWPLVVALAVVAGAGVALGAQKQSPVSVFVTSLGATSELTDPNQDNVDTVKNLRNSIKGHKALILTDKRDEAVVVLVVTGRENGRPCTVRVKFIFKDSEIEMSASSNSRGAAWRDAADKIVNQVERWVVANRAKLTETPR